MLRTIGRTPSLAMGGAMASTIVWGLGSGSNTSRLVVLAPVALVVPGLIAELQRRTTPTRRWPALAVAPSIVASIVVSIVASIVAVILLSTRPGGWSTSLFVTVVEQSDDNLVEAIGLLGWLDTPVPAAVVFGWLFGLGALAAAGFTDRTWVPASLLVALTAATAWAFELIQGNTSGTYWQGRYSLPLLVGLPLLLVDRSRAGLVDRLAPPLAVGSMLGVHVAIWAAGRRFGVGLAGSRLPWRWDTPLQPVPPVVLVVVSGLAACALAIAVVRADPAHR
jgi:hypothetical protein